MRHLTPACSPIGLCYLPSYTYKQKKRASTLLSHTSLGLGAIGKRLSNPANASKIATPAGVAQW